MDFKDKSFSTDGCNQFPLFFPPQHQNRQPGMECTMNPKPIAECCRNQCRRLEGKIALITGGLYSKVFWIFRMNSCPLSFIIIFFPFSI